MEYKPKKYASNKWTKLQVQQNNEHELIKTKIDFDNSNATYIKRKQSV